MGQTYSYEQIIRQVAKQLSQKGYYRPIYQSFTHDEGGYDIRWTEDHLLCILKNDNTFVIHELDFNDKLINQQDIPLPKNPREKIRLIIKLVEPYLAKKSVHLKVKTTNRVIDGPTNGPIDDPIDDPIEDSTNPNQVVNAEPVILLESCD